MDFLKPVLLLVLSEQCFDEYFLKFNFLDIPCFKSTLSKGLGLGIIIGSVLVKLPQILKIYRSKSGEGINVLSVTFDLCAITIVVSYSFVNQFPFSAWGDGAFLAIQTLIIGVSVMHYGKETTKAVLYTIAYFGLCFVMMSGLTPLNILWSLQALNIPILLIGKLTQAYTNYVNKSTGQLSAVTVFMLFAGSAARIFTSIQETGDSMMVITYCASTFANSVIVSQMLYYWNVDAKRVKKSKKTR